MPSTSNSPERSPPISPSTQEPSAMSASPLGCPAFFDSSGSLCGWLHKGTAESGAMSTGDRPKLRWFVYNEKTSELAYYRTPKDTAKLGAIPVSEAAFLPEATLNSDRFYVLSIVTSKKTYKLYHAQKATLDYWRQALQRRRSSMQQVRLDQAPLDADNVAGATAKTPQEERRSRTFEVEPHLEVEPRVHETNRFVGPHTESHMHTGLSDISMRNISTEARNKFRALFRHDDTSKQTSVTAKTTAPANSKTNAVDGASCAACRELRCQKRDLEDNLAACQSKLISLQSSLRLLDAPPSGGELAKRLKHLQIEKDERDNQIQVFSEVISDKDQQIMRLQNALAAIEENPFGEEEFRVKYTTMFDQMSAYKEQNQALNAEILNLRGLFGASVEHERELIDAVKKLHDIYSMAILKLKKRVEELSEPQLGRPEGAVDVRDQAELLADALIDSQQPTDSLSEESLHLKNLVMVAQGQMTDEYGFYVVRRELETQQMMDLTQLGPEINISQYLDTPPIDHDREASLTAKWERFLDENGLQIDGSFKPVQKSPELKAMLRQGCPTRLRGRVWRALILYYIGEYRAKNKGEMYYQEHLNMQASKYIVERKQIELDLHRSLPENCFFNVEHQPSHMLKLDSLKRILLAFCVVNSIGYCQGLDRIASILLLILEEELAFWGLQVVVSHLRSSEYYSRSLRDAQVDQRVFKDLVASHIPQLSKHLAIYDVDVSLFSFNWFLTLFVDGFHWSVFMKIWDAFLFEGDKVIFRYAIAVMMYLEPILMHCREVTDIYKILRNAGRYVKDHNKLTEIAFGSLRSFPKRRIKQKRLHYAHVVDQEIRQVNEERENLRKRNQAQSMFRDDTDDEGQ